MKCLTLSYLNQKELTPDEPFECIVLYGVRIVHGGGGDSKFDLQKCINFRSTVKHLKVLGNEQISSQWTTSTGENGNVETHIETFDNVCVCNGHYARPSMPKLHGFDNFRGNFIHAIQYDNPEPYTGKTVEPGVSSVAQFWSVMTSHCGGGVGRAGVVGGVEHFEAVVQFQDGRVVANGFDEQVLPPAVEAGPQGVPAGRGGVGRVEDRDLPPRPGQPALHVRQRRLQRPLPRLPPRRVAVVEERRVLGGGGGGGGGTARR